MHLSEPLDAQPARYHRREARAITQPDPAVIEQNIQIARLRQFLRWLLLFVVGFALLQIGHAMIYPSVSARISAIILRGVRTYCDIQSALDSSIDPLPKPSTGSRWGFNHTPS